ncbi:MAG TPA: ATP-binding protein, partial [Acidimicrobiia bacterium]
DPDDAVVATFTLRSEEGNERIAIARVSEAIAGLGLEPSRLERLKTAVGETVMNAIEHGNHGDPDLDVDVVVSTSDLAVKVRVTDKGGDGEIPEAATPDLEAKLAGEQTPRGWGLFLIGQMVDEVNRHRFNGTHTVELVMNKKGAEG